MKKIILPFAFSMIPAILSAATGATQLDVCLYDDGGFIAGQWDEGDGVLSCTQLPLVRM